MPKLPALPTELYEFYPGMSAQTHADAVRDYTRAALASQSAQIAELQAEVERRGSETNAGYFVAQLEAMTRERDAYVRACDSYLEEIADLKRALDTARHDALEEAAKVGMTAARNGFTAEQIASGIRALKTKDQSHGA